MNAVAGVASVRAWRSECNVALPEHHGRGVVALWTAIDAMMPKWIGGRAGTLTRHPDGTNTLDRGQNDEWLVGRRYLSAAAMEPLLEQRLHRDTTPDREEVRELTPA